MSSFFITTPIYYVNDKPHIGTSYTTIACDILARYHKLKGEDIFFLTGTDEHGQKVEKAAINESIKTISFVDKMSQYFKDLIPFLGCEINDFIRTTEKRHITASQHLWNKIFENNQIYLSNYEGWYSVRDEAFYTESEIIKKNNNFFAPSGSPVEWVKEESYFFKLSEWQDRLIEYYENNPTAISPKSRYNEVLSFIKGGLKDLSISRTTFNWGIPVPNNAKHVMYVWIDALCNYLTAIEYPDTNSAKFKKFWPGIHIIGKDILRFHAVYWPAFLMAADLDPPKNIFAHGWWTNEGQKISKSLGNVIDPYDIINEYGLDQIRYFLFREVPFGNDGDFSKKSISQRVNADLSNNYGNLIQRIFSFVKKNCDSVISNNFTLNKEDEKILNESIICYQKYINHMDNMNIDKALKEVFQFLSEINIYVDKQEPWSLKKTDKKRMNVVLSVSAELIKRSTILLYPIIPSSCEKVFSIIKIDKTNINLNDFEKLPNQKILINDPFPIFPRIEIDD
ncbi:MAG: Methionine--tRNA ligase [Alphaproteobacteria bacterium MarineAlpha5_Bin8]|nr:MAG: Methionine--tRNA ligase [Alphaproteobacteria bacterium MarineAlpha5_Bin8]PPR44804.1 MAG: Methionine--tRNA ligase [Alphaproteobacteria bacterium MarineAlpha5_Bin7]PPR54502.1 MAG: Methionine--tRNA ligase [Alphaproteobacteria bacterium MarineAlpha5_Bin6]|tara:strand:- start:8354 stop:9880 length:1527 start_codon:yes stop_codon:yes gene_type:complete